MTTVPLDSTTYVTLKDEERDALRTRDRRSTRALESLYRLWIENPSTRMTLHDQLAVAETVRPGAVLRPEGDAADRRGRPGLHAGGRGERGAGDCVLRAAKRDVFM